MKAVVVVVTLAAELAILGFATTRTHSAPIIPPVSYVKNTPPARPDTASRSLARPNLPRSAFAAATNPAAVQGMIPDIVNDAYQSAPDATPSSPAQTAEQASPTGRMAGKRSSVATRSPDVGPEPLAHSSASGPDVWDRLAQCESRSQWHIHTGNGYEGGLQFLNSTWLSMGGGQYAKHAYQATREQQITIAEKTLAASSWAQQWPACSKKLGLR